MSTTYIIMPTIACAGISHAQDTSDPAQKTETTMHQPTRAQLSDLYETHVRGMITHKKQLADTLALAVNKNTADTTVPKAAQAFRNMYIFFRDSQPDVKKAIEELTYNEIEAINNAHQQARDAAEQALDKEVLRISLHESFGHEQLAHLMPDIIVSGLIPVESLQQEQTDPEALKQLEHAMRAHYTQMIGNLQTLLAEIQSIHDKTTADTAAARIRTFFSEQQKTEETAFVDMVHTYGAPPDALKQKIMDEFLPQLRQYQTTSEELKQKLEQTNFYGSQELHKALNQQPET